MKRKKIYLPITLLIVIGLFITPFSALAGSTLKAPALSNYSNEKGAIVNSWTKTSGASGYQIYRATKRTGTYKRIFTTAKRTYTDKHTTLQATYYYKVRAYKVSSGKKRYSKYSGIVSAQSVEGDQISFIPKLYTHTDKSYYQKVRITNKGVYPLFVFDCTFGKMSDDVGVTNIINGRIYKATNGKETSSTYPRKIMVMPGKFVTITCKFGKKAVCNNNSVLLLDAVYYGENYSCCVRPGSNKIWFGDFTHPCP